MKSVIMVLILVSLAAVLIIRDKSVKNTTFFDLTTTKSMRGFWSIVILLVHVPTAYQNSIQDMIGSFAYIGVTFFFMTSGYGLMLSIQRNPESINVFWRKRLPKLLIPMLILNIVQFAVKFFVFGSIDFLNLLSITGWVRQLLIFYFLFWVFFRFIPGKISLKAKSAVLCACVLILSIAFYLVSGRIQVWPTESYGFIYGILLAIYIKNFEAFALKNWWFKVVLLCSVALIFGLVYLKFKYIIFFGDYIIKILLCLFITAFILLLNAKISIGNPISRFLGDISYEIYLFHGIVFTIVDATFTGLNSGIYILLSIMITVILSWFANRLSYILLSKCLKTK